MFRSHPTNSHSVPSISASPSHFVVPPPPSYAATINSNQLHGLPRFSKNNQIKDGIQSNSTNSNIVSPLYPSVSSSFSSTSFPPPSYSFVSSSSSSSSFVSSSSSSNSLMTLSNSFPSSDSISSFSVPNFLNSIEYDYLVKSILVGDSGVGKSCLLTRFSSNRFIPPDECLSTIGVDFEVRTMKIDDKIVKLQLWDTAGQERFKTITSSYYRGANIILVVFDLTLRESFLNLPNWIKEILQFISSDAIILIIGNKSDLTKNRVVSTDEIQSMCEELTKLINNQNLNQSLEFIETSAKSNKNVQKAFIKMNEKFIREKNRKIQNGEEQQADQRNFNGKKIDDSSQSRWICPNGCAIQ